MEIGVTGSNGSHAHQHVAQGSARDFVPVMHLPLKIGVASALEINTKKAYATKNHVQVSILDRAFMAIGPVALPPLKCLKLPYP